MPFRKPPGLLLLAALLIYSLYFFHLTAAGLLGPDEPRYASIGREMARSGDWITPRLWGQPWFEKPALLYWMTAAAFRAGFGEDLAPRIGVAALAAAFLPFFFWILRREYGDRAAGFATVILATSAGWVGFSQIGVTDLPLAATFSAAVLLALPWVRTGERRWLPAAGAMLGLAVLAKGLVPLVLILPVLWAGRHRLRDLLRVPVWGALAAASLPWYLLCFLRNGWPFLKTFFWEHHFERFATGSLLHGQPLWFYLPVLLAGLFPWTPLLVLLAWRKYRSGCNVLLLTVLFGLIFFSLSFNKLPGYLLPLVPLIAAALGVALAEAPNARWLLGACGLLLVLIPLVAGALPQALARGITRSHFSSIGWTWIPAVLVCFAAVRLRREIAVLVLGVAITAGVVFLKIVALPAVDQAVSARPLWREIAGQRGQVCVEHMLRSWRYGLNYYSVDPLPDCDAAPRPLHVVQLPGAPPSLAASVSPASR